MHKKMKATKACTQRTQKQNPNFAEEENIGPIHKFCHRIGFAKIK